MKKARYLGLLAIAVLAMAAFAAPASAGTGTGTVTMDDGSGPGTPCDVTFTYDGGVPGSGALTDIADNDCELEGFGIDVNDSTLNASFTAGNAASVSGDLTATVFGSIDCTYSASLSGSWSSGVNYNVSGNAVPDPGNFFLCPSATYLTSITGTITP